MTMFIVFLRFSGNKQRAGELSAAHNAWVRDGLDDGSFMLVGSLQPALGGVVLAHEISRAALDAKIAADPFVAHDVVRAEVFELSPNKVDPRLGFLLP